MPNRWSLVMTRRWSPHVVLFALALAIRTAWVLAVRRAGFAFGDALNYHVAATSVAHGKGYQTLRDTPSARWPPGYTTVLAGVYRVFGVDPRWGELLNALLGAVTVVLLVVVVERWIDRTTAVVAGVILAILPGPIIWTDLVVSETLYMMLFVLMFAVLAYATPRWPWLIALGVVIGLGGLVRGEALTWGLLPIVLWHKQLSLADLAKRIGAIAGVTVLLLMPWTIRNAVVMDAFVPLATNASETLWAGHNPSATGGQVYPPDAYYERFDDVPGNRWELEISAALRADALSYMVRHPVREIELIPLKLIHLNRGDSYALDWVNTGAEAGPIAAIDAERIGVLADFGYFGLLTLTLLGAVLLGRSFWRAAVGRCIAASFLTALVLYGFVYYGNYRYRLAYEPLMVIAAATLVTRLWRVRRGTVAP